MTERKSKNRRSKAPADAIAMLTQDHRMVQQLFKDFEKGKEKMDDETKAELVRTACQELTIHAQLEEELFYPAVREAIESHDILDEAEVEHTTAKQLIGELERMKPDNELYDAKFTVLGEYVNHHIKEEQGEMFKKAKASDLDLVELGERMMRRKEELQSGTTRAHVEA
jgi:hemerythrin superfamily protein